MSRSIGAFVLLTFVISWSIWLALAVTSVGIDQPVGAVLNVVATAGPSLAAIILALRGGGGAVRQLVAGLRVRPGWRWVVIAIALPLVMVGLSILASAGAMGGPVPILSVAVIGALALEFVRVLLVGGPLEEELGWRGYALPRLQAARSAFDASLILGLIWGVWHIPLYLVQGTGQAATISGGMSPAFAIGAFVVWTIGLSILFTWLFNSSGGSLLVVILFHASVNLGSFVPGAVASTGASSLLYALATWIVALLVTAHYGQTTLSRATPTIMTSEAAA